MKRYPFSLLLPLLFCVLTAWADGTGDLPELKSSASAWMVGFSEFYLENDDPSLAWLAASLPLKLRAGLSNCTEHRLTEKESAFIREELLSNAVLSKQKTRDEQYRKNEESLFYSPDRAITGAMQRALEQQQTSLDQYREGAVVYDIPESLPLQFSGSDEQPLIAADTPIHHALKVGGNDYIVRGYLSGSGDFAYAEISLFTRYAVSPLSVLTYSFSVDDTDWVVEDAIKGLRAVLLGHEWAELSFTTEPESALISLNGEITGQHERYLVEPGEIQLEILASGYEAYREVLSVTSGEIAARNITLVASAVTSVMVTSEPPGCDVYYQSILLGETPLSVPVSGQARILYLTEEGYIPRQVTLSPVSQTLSLRLEPLIRDPELVFKEKRRAYYRAFSWASLSYTVPFFLLGVEKDYESAWSYSGAADDYDRAVLLQTAGWAAMGVTALLTVNVIWKLIDMLKSANHNLD